MGAALFDFTDYSRTVAASNRAVRAYAARVRLARLSSPAPSALSAAQKRARDPDSARVVVVASAPLGVHLTAVKVVAQPQDAANTSENSSNAPDSDFIGRPSNLPNEEKKSPQNAEIQRCDKPRIIEETQPEISPAIGSTTCASPVRTACDIRTEPAGEAFAHSKSDCLQAGERSVILMNPAQAPIIPGKCLTLGPSTDYDLRGCKVSVYAFWKLVHMPVLVDRSPEA